jgi:RNA-directed DNA polymerase
VSIEQVIGEINSFTRGWVAFFRHAECKSHLQRLDEWIRRKLRCVRLKQCKRTKTIAQFLQSLGVPKRRAWIGASCGKGWWRHSGTPAVMEGMSLNWFKTQRLVSLLQRYCELNP